MWYKIRSLLSHANARGERLRLLIAAMLVSEPFIWQPFGDESFKPLHTWYIGHGINNIITWVAERQKDQLNFFLMGSTGLSIGCWILKLFMMRPKYIPCRSGNTIIVLANCRVGELPWECSNWKLLVPDPESPWGLRSLLLEYCCNYRCNRDSDSIYI